MRGAIRWCFPRQNRRMDVVDVVDLPDLVDLPTVDWSPVDCEVSLARGQLVRSDAAEWSERAAHFCERVGS